MTGLVTIFVSQVVDRDMCQSDLVKVLCVCEAPVQRTLGLVRWIDSNDLLLITEHLLIAFVSDLITGIDIFLKFKVFLHEVDRKRVL